jgi:hypothetical protein
MYLLDESGAIFVATSTSNNVAVLRTLPEMVMSPWETTGCYSAERVKTIAYVAYVVELLNVVQNCNRMHGYVPFLRV